MTKTTTNCDGCGIKINHQNPDKISFNGVVSDSSGEKYKIPIPEPFSAEEICFDKAIYGSSELCLTCYPRIMTIALKKFDEIRNNAKEEQKSKRCIEVLTELKELLREEIAVHNAPSNEMEQGFVKGIQQVITYFINPMLAQHKY